MRKQSRSNKHLDPTSVSGNLEVLGTTGWEILLHACLPYVIFPNHPLLTSVTVRQVHKPGLTFCLSSALTFWLLHRWIIFGYHIVGYCKTKFAFRRKSNKFREPEIDIISWGVSAPCRAQEHSNQMQKDWVRIQKQDNRLGKVKDVNNPNVDHKKKCSRIQFHTDI